jgi:Tetratricopeptide repeat
MHGDLTALDELRELVPLMNHILGEENEETLTACLNLATALQMTGKTNAAERELRRVLRICGSNLGYWHPLASTAREMLNDLLGERKSDRDFMRDLQ